jgi:hypothetical protein
VQCGVEQHGVVERVFAQQHRRDVAGDDAERGQPAQHRRGLADPAMDANESAALRRLVVGRPADLEDLDPLDLHTPPQ